MVPGTKIIAFDRPDEGTGYRIDKAQKKAFDEIKGLRAKGLERRADNLPPADQRRMASVFSANDTSPMASSGHAAAAPTNTQNKRAALIIHVGAHRQGLDDGIVTQAGEAHHCSDLLVLAHLLRDDRGRGSVEDVAVEVGSPPARRHRASEERLGAVDHVLDGLLVVRLGALPEASGGLV